jgi:hypothetical protein
MAFKNDTCWTDHPPIGHAPAWRPGLQLLEVVRRRDYVYLFGSIGLFIIGYLVLRWMAPDAVNILTLLGCFFWPLIVAVPALDGAMRRYRLYVDGQDAPEFDGKPASQHEMLARIARSPELMAHLGPPNPSSAPPSVLRHTLPAIAAVIPLFLMMGGLFVLMISLSLLLTGPVDQVEIIIVAVLSLQILLPTLLFAGMYLRARAGVRTLGAGLDADDGENTTASFDDVSEARLCRDRWLGTSYLLLDLEGRKLRYYNATEDPLHLLRVLKHRTPQVKLHP